MPPKTPRQEQDKLAIKTSENFRTEILVYAIDCERILTDIIISRFTKKPREFIKYILYFEKTLFERKIELVKFILELNYPTCLPRYKKTFEQLGQIRDIRNALSHYHSSYENNGKQTVFVLSPSIVQLKKGKNGKWVGIKVKKFSVRQMNGLVKMVEKCNTELRQLNSEVS